MNVARLRSPVYALCLSILAVAAACGTADVPPKKQLDTTGSGGTDTTTGSGGSSAAGSAGTMVSTSGAGGSSGGGAGTDMTTTGTGGSGGTDATGAGGSGPPPLTGPIVPLPIIVDNSYAASGYMGDGMVAGSIVADATCAARAPGNIGKCTRFTYTPQATSTYGWGGVYWQFPANNWGALPGERIAAGATKVTFYAAGAKGGEKVNFFVGGITGATYQDPPKVSLDAQVLTTTMTQYSIDLTGYTYDAVMGGFGWSIEAPPAGDAGAFDATPIIFAVDGIQWVM